MRILLVNLGNPCECLISTSVVNGLHKKYPEHDIFAIGHSQESCRIFSCCSGVRKTYHEKRIPAEFWHSPIEVGVNLTPGFDLDSLPAQFGKKFGFHASPKADQYIDALTGESKCSKSLFQVYNNLSGMTWRGNGSSLQYYPKSRCKKNRIGLAVANANLRSFIIDKLRLDSGRVWVVPFRKNMFRKMDELNKCGKIITDDFATLNASLFLRKESHFLKAVPHNMKIEMFGSGNIYNIPRGIVQ